VRLPRALLADSWRIVRFGLVGLIATGVHTGVSLCVYRFLGLPPVVANGTGFCIALLFSMAGHSRFTFRQSLSWSRAARFVTVALSSVLFSSTVVLLAQHFTPLRPELYLAGAALLTAAFNFTLHSLWTFARPQGIVV
jgi:putative flippase GtrA